MALNSLKNYFSNALPQDQESADHEFQIEMLRFYFQAQKRNLFGSIVLVSVMAGLIWYNDQANIVWYWVGYMTAAFLYRYVTNIQFFAVNHEQLSVQHIEKWSDTHKRHLALAGLGWGLIGAYSQLYFKEQTSVQMCIILCGVTISGVLSHPGHRFTAIYFPGFVLGPSIVTLYFSPYEELHVLSGLILLMYATVVKSTTTHSVLVGNVHREMDKNKKLLRELSSSYKEIQDLQAQNINSSKMAALGEMASGMAHEINNPLLIISFNADHLKMRLEEGQKVSTEEIIKPLGKIIETTERISRIIRGLKNFARQGEQDPFSTIALKPLLLETLELSSVYLKNTSIQLTVDDVPDNIYVDCRPSQIAQVLVNLISNAKDAIDSYPEDKKWIRVSYRCENNQHILSVIDGGSGVPLTVQEKMFQPFYTTKGVGKGTGLGLSISKGIMSDHHGDLRINNDCKNTCFELVIPVSIDKKNVA